MKKTRSNTFILENEKVAENEQAHIRGLLAEAIENAEMDSESFLGFQLAFEDGTWVLPFFHSQPVSQIRTWNRPVYILRIFLSSRRIFLPKWHKF